MYTKINRTGDRLFNGIRDIAKDRKMDVWVESVGALGEVFFTDKEIRTWRDEQDVDRAKWEKWFLNNLAEGVFFGVPHPDGHAFTSIKHTDEIIDRSLEIFDDSFRMVAE
jgi:glutamate-1-semialdehyde 2,1-aminomutase